MIIRPLLALVLFSMSVPFSPIRVTVDQQRLDYSAWLRLREFGLALPADITCHIGCNLQSAINAAVGGDNIVLDPSTLGSYTVPGIPSDQNSFSLPIHSGASYVTIKPSTIALLPSGRVTAADKGNMARIVAISGRGAFQVAANAQFWKLDGLEATNSSTGTGTEHVQDLIGSGDAAYSSSSKPAHFVINRCYFHPQEDGLATNDPFYNYRSVSHGVSLWAADVSITNSRFSGFFGAYRHTRKVFSDGVVNGTSTLTSASAGFTSSDAGLHIAIISGPNAFFSTVASVTNPSTVVMTSAAPTSASGQTVYLGLQMDSQAITYAKAPGPLVVNNNFLQQWYGSLVGGADSDTDNFGTISGATTPSTTQFSVTLTNGSLPTAGDMLAVANAGKEPSACKVSSAAGSSVTCETRLVWNGAANAGGPDQMVAAPAPVVGAAVKWRGYVMDSVTWTRNTFNIDSTDATFLKSLTGEHPKGYIEFKIGDHILFEGNLLGGYPSTVGFGLQNQAGGAPWSSMRHLILRSNFFQNYAQVFGPMSNTGYSRLTETGIDVLITNNLGIGPSFDGVVNYAPFYTDVSRGMDGPLTITHNTVLSSDTNAGTFVFQFDNSKPKPDGSMPTTVITGTTTIQNNIIYTNNFGISCALPGGLPSNCLTSYVSDKNLVVKNNAGVTDGQIAIWFPGAIISANTAGVGFTNSSATATAGYRLLNTSPGFHAATDGTDTGVDITALDAALGGSLTVCRWATGCAAQ